VQGERRALRRPGLQAALLVEMARRCYASIE
jgi:hypothetical protein